MVTAKFKPFCSSPNVSILQHGRAVCGTSWESWRHHRHAWALHACRLGDGPETATSPVCRVWRSWQVRIIKNTSSINTILVNKHVQFELCHVFQHSGILNQLSWKHRHGGFGQHKKSIASVGPQVIPLWYWDFSQNGQHSLRSFCEGCLMLSNKYF